MLTFFTSKNENATTRSEVWKKIMLKLFLDQLLHPLLDFFEADKGRTDKINQGCISNHFKTVKEERRQLAIKLIVACTSSLKTLVKVLNFIVVGKFNP